MLVSLTSSLQIYFQTYWLLFHKAIFKTLVSGEREREIAVTVSTINPQTEIDQANEPDSPCSPVLPLTEPLGHSVNPFPNTPF